MDGLNLKDGKLRMCLTTIAYNSSSVFILPSTPCDKTEFLCHILDFVSRRVENEVTDEKLHAIP